MEHKLFMIIMISYVSASMLVLGDNQYQPPSSSYFSGNSQQSLASTYYDPQPAAAYSSEQSFGESAYSTETDSQASSFDLSLIVIPLLIVAGISLLFPTITNVVTRKRRNAGGKNTQTHVHKNTLTQMYRLIKLPCTKKKALVYIHSTNSKNSPRYSSKTSSN